MPAFYTHRYFAKEVFKKLPKKIQNQINYDYFLLFAQSFDFLYYNKKTKDLASKAHKKNTQEFFINTINFIQDKNNNQYYLSFLYGTLTHYILDSTFHPYIFYKSGTYKTNNLATHKYNGLHTKTELMIDYYFYSKNNTIPFYKAKHYKIYDNINEFPQDLMDLIDYSFKKTYNFHNIGYYYFKCVKRWKIITRFFKIDKFKIKKYLYKLIDNIRGPKYKKIEYYSYYLKDNITNIINNNHKIWLNPANKNMKYNYSIDDLLDEAIEKYIKIAIPLYQILNNNRNDSSLEKLIPNISYHSGLDLNLKPILKYFEK